MARDSESSLLVVSNDTAAMAIVFSCFIGILAGDTAFSFDGGASVELRYAFLAITLILWLPWRSTGSVKWGQTSRLVVGFTVAWCAAMTTSALWAAPDSSPADTIVQLFTMIAFIALAVDVTSRSPYVLDILPLLLVFVGLVFFAGAIVSGPVSAGRYAAFGGGPNVFVRIEAFGMFSALWIAISRGKPWAWGCAAVLFVGVIVSGSRGGLTAVGVGALLLLPMAWSELKSRGRLVRATLGGVAVGAVVASVLFERFAEIAEQRFALKNFTLEASAGRGDLYAAAWDLFARRPLQGWGLGGFESEYGQFVGFSYSHNLFLDVAAEAGLIGLGVLGPLVAVCSGLLFKGGGGFTLGRMYGLLGVCMLVASQFSGTYYDTRYVWFFFALSAVSAGINGERTLSSVNFGSSKPFVER